MDIKDLMIGDYVYETTHKEPRICKVTGIRYIPGYDMNSVYAEPLCSPGNNVDFLDGDIAPIPLTKEMLMANGWKENPTLMYEKENYYYNGLRLYPYGNLWNATHRRNNLCLFGNVHELQRLMRCLKVFEGHTFKLE